MKLMKNFLEEIIAHKKREVETAKEICPFSRLEKNLAVAPSTRDFREALREGKPPRIIAEIKRKSPSKGDINPTLDTRRAAKEYELGGAIAISVLTDAQYFGGSLEDLKIAKKTVSIPVMRKDFIIDEYQVVEAKSYGADALLLIVSALPQNKLKSLMRAAGEWNLATLVEVHDEGELETAFKVDAPIIGINTRNLKTFEVDASLPLKLRDKIPSSVKVVVESGIKTKQDIQRYMAVGYEAFLIGETLAGAGDRIKALSQLF